jgi:DNA-binding NarL/FixJ family response regulator
VAEGQTKKQTGETLGNSVKTGEKNRPRLMNKLDIHETAGLIR